MVINGKQMVQFKTWIPPDGLTAKQAEKEARRLAILFEEECAHGRQVTTTIKFQKLCEQWFSEYAELNHRGTTLQREHLFTDRVYPAIGHLFASIEIEAGIDPTTVAAMLGHSTPQTTVNTPKGHTPPIAAIFDKSKKVQRPA